MAIILSNKYGCKVLEKGNKLFVRFDDGRSVSKMIEMEITKEEAEKLILSETDAYEVLLKIQHRNK